MNHGAIVHLLYRAAHAMIVSASDSVGFCIVRTYLILTILNTQQDYTIMYNTGQLIYVPTISYNNVCTYVCTCLQQCISTKTKMYLRTYLHSYFYTIINNGLIIEC